MDEETRDVLALLIVTLTTGPITPTTMKPLVERLGKDWHVIERRVKGGTGPLKLRYELKGKDDEQHSNLR